MNPDTIHDNPVVHAASGEDVDLLKWILLLWARWRWILGAGATFGLLGMIFAYTTTPVYRSEAVISPKSESNNARVLSRLGGLGGMVATTIDAGNTPLDRLELIATSRTLARSLIAEHNLLPVLYPSQWDAENKQWENGKAPNLDGAAMYLRSGPLDFVADRKKNAIVLGIETYDPQLAARLVEIYLAGLNKAIQRSVVEDAMQTRAYLEEQLMNTGDPQIQLKIEQLIAQEVEKAALVSSRAFDLIEGPWVPRGPKYPKKRQIIGIALLMGLVLGAMGVVVNEKVRDFRTALRARR